MSNERQPPVYKPPVLERVLFVSAKIDEKIFDENRDSFLETLKKFFPISDYRTFTETKIKLTTKVESQSIAEKSIHVEYVLWRSEDRHFSVTFTKEKLHFNLLRNKENVGSFNEIFEVAKAVISEWMDTFGLLGEDVSVSVQYVNDPTGGKRFVKINPADYVSFAPHVKNRKASGKVEDLPPPWRVMFSLPVSDEKKDLITVDASIDNNVRSKSLSFLVLFMYRLVLADAKPEDIFEGFQIGHKIILNCFDIYFTDRAKRGGGDSV